MVRAVVTAKTGLLRNVLAANVRSRSNVAPLSIGASPSSRNEPLRTPQECDSLGPPAPESPTDVVIVAGFDSTISSQEMRVSELVPEIAGAPRFAVRAIEMAQ
jgi:hypothetical protein